MATLRFNALLAEARVDPATVRVLRHETRNHGLTPYALWRDDPSGFETYQRVQRRDRRGWFARPRWASFVVEPGGGTLFAGLYSAEVQGPVPSDWLDPISGRDAVASADYEVYRTSPAPTLATYIGRLVIESGAGSRTWSQRAEQQDKPIVELRRSFTEPEFPGYAAFVSRLSEIEAAPLGWRGAPTAARGVYLLTCPRTREQYVGSAAGGGGFLARWLEYARDGHGGNVRLLARERADYQVSILQIAGSADRPEDVLAMEEVWKIKLQSREMGLNANCPPQPYTSAPPSSSTRPSAATGRSRGSRAG